MLYQCPPYTAIGQPLQQRIVFVFCAVQQIVFFKTVHMTLPLSVGIGREICGVIIHRYDIFDFLLQIL